jgi:hypothetical protein
MREAEDAEVVDPRLSAVEFSFLRVVASLRQTFVLRFCSLPAKVRRQPDDGCLFAAIPSSHLRTSVFISGLPVSVFLS